MHEPGESSLFLTGRKEPRRVSFGLVRCGGLVLFDSLPHKTNNGLDQFQARRSADVAHFSTLLRVHSPDSLLSNLSLSEAGQVLQDRFKRRELKKSRENNFVLVVTRWECCAPHLRWNM